MTLTRSTTGCFTCKSRHKRCDETKPRCLRCQKAGLECSGYTYIHDPSGKPRTLPAPRTAHQSQISTLQSTSLASTGEMSLQPCLDNYSVAPYTSHGVAGIPAGGGASEPAQEVPITNQLASSSTISRPFVDLTTDLHESHALEVNTVNSGSIHPSPSTSTTTPLSSGQASLLAALFSLGQSLGSDTSPQGSQPNTNPNVTLISTWTPQYTGKQDDARLHEYNTLEYFSTVIRPEIVLDRGAENNALPFVLQGYASLIGRMALEPQKLMSGARDFVFRHFEDGEESRWIVGLLANVGSRIATVEVMKEQYDPEPLISVLNSTVRRRVTAVKSRPNSTRAELAMVLSSALEVLAIHNYANSPTEAIGLRREVAPIFRQLCLDTPDTPIDLVRILQHPLRSIRQYAGTSAIFGVLSDMPTVLRYEVPVPGSQHSNPYLPLLAIQEDGIIQWVYGVPNQITLLLATMKAMKQDRFVPNEEVVALLERDIREVPPFTGSASDRFLAVMRSVVQECWRQTAFIYLYMGVCGDPSDASRVVEAFKRFMKLLNGTRPGRLPDEILTPSLIIVAPAAQRIRDREVIRQRAVRLRQHGQTFPSNDSILRIIEDYWARADAEGRPIMWSDIAVSRARVLGR